MNFDPITYKRGTLINGEDLDQTKKNHINYKIENHNIQKLNFKNRGGSVLPYHTLHCMINFGNTLVETTTTTNNTQLTKIWYYYTTLNPMKQRFPVD